MFQTRFSFSNCDCSLKIFYSSTDHQNFHIIKKHFCLLLIQYLHTRSFKMLAIRRAATRAFTSRICLVSSPIQSRFITTLPSSVTRSTFSSIIPLSQRRFASDDAVEKKNAEETEEIDPIVSEAISAAEPETHSVEEPIEPETTSAAEFDASDVQPVQPRDVSRSERSGDSFGASEEREPVSPRKNLYIGNLFFDVTEEDLRREFSRFGTLVDLKIIKDPRGMSRGFAYITYLDQTDATSAVETLHGQVFEGRRLTVQYSVPKALDQNRRERKSLRSEETAPPSRTLYIGNMAFDLSDQDLSQLFSGIKNVLDVRVAIDRRTGQPRGFAHADFTDIESAEVAFKVLNNKEVHGRNLRCDYSGPSSRVRPRGNIS